MTMTSLTRMATLCSDSYIVTVRTVSFSPAKMCVVSEFIHNFTAPYICRANQLPSLPSACTGPIGGTYQASSDVCSWEAETTVDEYQSKTQASQNLAARTRIHVSTTGTVLHSTNT